MLVSDSPNCKKMNLQSPAEMPGPNLTKRCSKCGGSGPFNKNRAMPDGLQRYCKECQSAATRKWQADNRDKANEIARRYWHGRGKEYFEENKDAILVYREQWFKDNPTKRTEYKRAYRARKNGTSDGNFTQIEFTSLCEAHNNLCLCCGEEGPLEADHVVPLVAGGSDAIENIQPLCRTCNASKGTQTIDYR